MKGVTDLEARLLETRGILDADATEVDAIHGLAACGRLRIHRMGDEWEVQHTPAGRAALRIYNALRGMEVT